METSQLVSRNDMSLNSYYVSDYHYKNIDYLALGHIHKYKQAELDQRGVYCYSGCLEGRGFDECGEKGFVLLDIDEESLKLKTVGDIVNLIDSKTKKNKTERNIDNDKYKHNLRGQAQRRLPSQSLRRIRKKARSFL